jgi:hypothetical protein
MQIFNRWTGQLILDIDTLIGADLSEAILYGANLNGADLSRANLHGADLNGADLRGADLSEAILYGANLSRANLNGADLSRANLSEANLSEADLSRANLNGADLSRANLNGADLSRANLNGADLSRAILSGVNLSRANLIGANLSGANLYGATDIPEYVKDITNILPEGDLIAFKKLAGDVIIKLRIPKEARRSNATGRKCRAEYAIVDSVVENPQGVQSFVSMRDSTFKYSIGETVYADTWCEDRWNECAGGIHFFLTKEEAERY